MPVKWKFDASEIWITPASNFHFTGIYFGEPIKKYTKYIPRREPFAKIGIAARLHAAVFPGKNEEG